MPLDTNEWTRRFTILQRMDLKIALREVQAAMISLFVLYLVSLYSLRTALVIASVCMVLMWINVSVEYRKLRSRYQELGQDLEI